MLVHNQIRLLFIRKNSQKRISIFFIRTFSIGKSIVLQASEKQKITTMKEARRFMVDCLKAVGTNKKNAEIVADNLLEADYRGIYSHGMNRLGRYIGEVENCLVEVNGEPEIESECVGTAVVNGNNGFGAVCGKFCMDLAIKKAKEPGVAVVTCRGSNHYGMAGMYTLQAIKKGFIGFSCTNTSPLMVPTRAKISTLGTNPISLAVPAIGGDSFVLDFATTAVAIGKIEIKRRRGLKVPKGWALTKDGKTESDPSKVVKTCMLLPLGGEEENGGYKGYGLGMFVEIFCGILSGSDYGPFVKPWTDKKLICNLGHCFMALNPEAFAPGVQERMCKLNNYIRKMVPINPDKPVMVHGDLERKHMEKVKADGGLRYVRNQHATNKKLAEKLKVSPMKYTYI